MRASTFDLERTSSHLSYVPTLPENTLTPETLCVFLSRFAYGVKMS